MIRIHFYSIYIFVFCYKCVNADIDVSLEGDLNKVTASGSDTALITDVERTAFGIDDYNLKQLIETEFGRRPDDAFVRGTTIWGNLYQDYNWKEIERTLVPLNAEMLLTTKTPVTLDTKIFENKESSQKNFKDIFYKQDYFTVSHIWNKSADITTAIKLKYKITLPTDDSSASLILSYKSNWGQPRVVSRPVTIGEIKALKFEVPPNTAVAAKFVVDKCTRQAQISYEASLDGRVVLNYGNPYKGHHFWSRDINIVNPLKLGSSEIVTLTYYTNAKVIIEDVNTKKILNEINLPIAVADDFINLINYDNEVGLK